MLSTFFLTGWLWTLALSGHFPGEEGEQLLFDFRKPAGWRPLNDGVMGGVSRSEVSQHAEGRLVFSGEVSLENNGGFASCRSTGPEFDLTGYTGIRLRVRGDGRRYQFSLNSSDRWAAPGFNAAFDTRPGEWMIVELPFDRFARVWAGGFGWRSALDLSRIATVGLLIGNKRAETFHLEVDWITAYREG